MSTAGSSQTTTRREHDLEKEARRVISVDPFGGIVTEGNFETRVDGVYFGKAQLGTATSEAKWQIYKKTVSGISFADNTDAFVKEWDERVSYEYSVTGAEDVAKSFVYGYNDLTDSIKALSVDDDGNLKTTASVTVGDITLSSADGAITDGSNASIKASVTSQNALKVDGSSVTQPVSGPLTDTQLRATPVPVTASIDTTGLATSVNQDTQTTAINTLLKPADTLAKVATVDTITNPVAVTGTFYQATQPVSGPLTDTELRATPVQVSGTISVSEPVTVDGTVTANISGFISNTSFTATQATGTNLHTVVDSGTITEINSGSIKTATEAINTKMVSGTDIGDVTINNATGAAAVNIQDGGNTITVDGTVSANATLAAETTKIIGTVNIAGSQTIAVTQATGNNLHTVVDSGVITSVTSLTNALPAGDNNIGNVDIASAIPSGTNSIGKLLPSDIDVTAHTNYARKYYTSAGAATDGIIWSPGAGKRWHVVTMYIQVSSASTITLEDDKSAGDDPVWKAELAANSGAVLSFSDKYPLASAEDAADLLITTTAGNVYVTCVGYEI